MTNCITRHVEGTARKSRFDSRSRGGTRRGFTLVELLVVVSIIAVLIGILVPAVGSARDAARGIVCGTTQRQLALAQIAHAADAQGVYAGVNGSNAQYLAILAGGGQPTDIGVNRIPFNTSSSTPTSTMDWISPSIGEAMNFSENRAKRTQQIFNQLACPSSRGFNQFLFPRASPPDKTDFEIINAEDYYQQISYLSPATFHYLSSQLTQVEARLTIAAPGRIVGGTYRRHDAPNESECRVPKGFRPNLDHMPNPSLKIMLSDATRFYSTEFTQGGAAALNFDHNHNPTNFGSFLTSSPMYVNATEWGRSKDGHKPADRWQLSIRHGKFASINAAYFDGHVATMERSEVYRDPTPWYPSGSEFLGGGSATPESIDWMTEFWENTGSSGSSITLY